MARFIPKMLVAALLLCAQYFSPERAFGGEHPKGTPFEMEATLNELLGEQEAARYREILAPGKTISWWVYLPDIDVTKPPGVFVYVSPRNRGQMDNRWRAAMDRHNLIYIGANHSGNRIPVNRRMVYALMALKALGKHYLVDSTRISISGFSGGGRVASMLASQYPEVFTGAVYICGVNFWGEELKPRIEQLVKNRFVFLTGSRDFNRDETQNVYRQYLKAGAQYSKLMIIPGMTHELADAEAMSEALDFLYGSGNDDASD